MPRTRRHIFATLVAALALVFAGLTPASAASSFTISGSVACQSGATVTGIWVRSSSGGSGWATYSKRSGAPWIANYTFTIKSSTSSTAVEIHTGCGGTTTTWKSNNRYKVGTLTASKAVSVICNNKSGVTAFSCRNWPNTVVLVGMPFTGRVNGDATTHTKSSGHDIAQDVYAVPGTTAKIWAFAPRGVTVALSVAKPSTGVCGGINVTVKANGATAGTVHFGHLVPNSAISSGGTVANGASLGTTKKWPYTPFNGVCGYMVNTDSGVHTHMALTSYNAWACFATYSGTRTGGYWIGMVGKTPATRAQQSCPMS